MKISGKQNKGDVAKYLGKETNATQQFLTGVTQLKHLVRTFKGEFGNLNLDSSPFFCFLFLVSQHPPLCFRVPNRNTGQSRRVLFVRAKIYLSRSLSLTGKSLGRCEEIQFVKNKTKKIFDKFVCGVWLCSNRFPSVRVKCVLFILLLKAVTWLSTAAVYIIKR